MGQNTLASPIVWRRGSEMLRRAFTSFCIGDLWSYNPKFTIQGSRWRQSAFSYCSTRAMRGYLRSGLVAVITFIACKDRLSYLNVGWSPLTLLIAWRYRYPYNHLNHLQSHNCSISLLHLNTNNQTELWQARHSQRILNLISSLSLDQALKSTSSHAMLLLTINCSFHFFSQTQCHRTFHFWLHYTTNCMLT